MVRVLTHHQVSSDTDTTQQEGGLVIPWGWKFRLYTQPSLTLPQSTGEPGQSETLGYLLGLCWLGCSYSFFFFFLWCVVAVGGYCLRVFYLAKLHFLVLWLERTGQLLVFTFFFFVCAHWHFQAAGFSSTWSGIFDATRKPRELITSSSSHWGS